MSKTKVRVPLLLTKGAAETLKTNALESGCLQTRGAGKGVLPSKSQYIEMLMKPGVVVLQPRAVEAVRSISDFIDRVYMVIGEYPEGLSESLAIVDDSLREGAELPKYTLSGTKGIQGE